MVFGRDDNEPEKRSPTQLALDLPVSPSFGREDFLPAPSNIAALTMIDQWPNWPDRLLLLLGPPGSGKSHLAAIWARRTGALTVFRRKLLSLSCLAMQKPSALLIDGVDGIRDEIALFHCLNFSQETGAFVMLTARRAPRAETVQLPDLLSRLRRAAIVEIGSPDDDLMRAVLIKHFRDRQLFADPELIDYIAIRLRRSLGAARSFVRELDREALARRRRVTRPLASELLARSGL